MRAFVFTDASLGRQAGRFVWLALDIENDKVLKVSRNVTTAMDDPLPSQLLPLLSAAPAHRVLRQHDLRRFVVDMEPGDKYAELSRWLSLERLREILGHLKTTENALRRTSPDKELEERRRDLALHTNGAVTTLDPPRSILGAERNPHVFSKGPQRSPRMQT